MFEQASGTTAAGAGVVELARALVATPSVNPTLDERGHGEAGAAALAAGWLEEWGFDVERHEFAEGRPSIVAQMSQGGGRTLLLAGHLDTVGVTGMDIEPFEASVRDGRLWGRGSADMKGGVAAALAAARELAAERFDGTVVVALTADEEEAGRGCRQLVDAGLRADGAIVCEPTSLAIMPAHKGFAWVRIEFRGQAAHGSRPERGVDAILHAGHFLARLEEVETRLTQRKRHPLLGFGSIHAGTITGGTSPSVYPSHCSLVLERRTLPGESPGAIRSEVEFLLAQLRSDVPSLDAGLEVILHRHGSEIPVDHEMVTVLSSALEDVGVAPKVRGMSAWVEASMYNEAGIPTVCFGPGSIGEAHTANESTPVAEIEDAQRALVAVARKFLA